MTQQFIAYPRETVRLCPVLPVNGMFGWARFIHIGLWNRTPSECPQLVTRQTGNGPSFQWNTAHIKRMESGHTHESTMLTNCLC